MEKRRLGRTNLDVSVIGFGGLPIQRLNMDDAGLVLNAAIDIGINFIDTARAYTDSEEKIGRNLSYRRDEFYLATKSLARDKESMARDIEQSLKMLKTDYIDIYQIHNVKKPEELMQVMRKGGAFEALLIAKLEGKIRHIGITGHNIDTLIKALETDGFDTVQVPFNCIETEAAMRLFPMAKMLDIGRIVMKPFGGGHITNANLSLRYIIEKDVSAVIPGMDDVMQVTENVQAAEPFIPLNEYERRILEEEAREIGDDFCRRCGYCLPCTKGIDIPQIFIFHGQYIRYGLKETIPKRYAAFAAKASDCIQCGVCEKRCPYHYPIMEKMAEAARDLG